MFGRLNAIERKLIAICVPIVNTTLLQGAQWGCNQTVYHYWNNAHQFIWTLPRLPQESGILSLTKRTVRSIISYEVRPELLRKCLNYLN